MEATSGRSRRIPDGEGTAPRLHFVSPRSSRFPAPLLLEHISFFLMCLAAARSRTSEPHVRERWCGGGMGSSAATTENSDRSIERRTPPAAVAWVGSSFVLVWPTRDLRRAWAGGYVVGMEAGWRAGRGKDGGARVHHGRPSASLAKGLVIDCRGSAFSSPLFYFSGCSVSLLSAAGGRMRSFHRTGPRARPNRRHGHAYLSSFSL